MRRYSLSDFVSVPIVGSQSNINIVVDDVVDVSTFGTDVAWTPPLVELYETELPQDRSTALMEAAYLAAENKWTDQQIMSLLYALDERWGKYVRRPKSIRQRLLQDILERARVRVGYNGLETITPTGFLEEHHNAVIEESEILGFNDFLVKKYPINWIFEGLLPQSGAGLMTGWPGAGKTTLSLQLATNAALGQDFLRWKCVRQCKVLYLSLEMAAPPLHLFVESMKEAFSRDELAVLNENLLLAPFGVPLHIDREEGYERFVKYLDQYRPDLVIVDSLSMMTPKDLTDEEAMKTLFDGLAVIRQEHDVAFIVVHHNRKKAADAQKNKQVEQSDIYGSTYITAKVDFAVNLTKMEAPNTVELATLKNRLGVEPDPFELIRKDMRFSDPTAMSGFFEGLDTE